MAGDKGKGFGIALIIGAVIGGLLALLLAPKSGKETRDDLKRRIGVGRNGESKKQRTPGEWQ